ncbi:hypothetical protein G3T36_08080 [Diaminobutyricibacter tongyongensis]|uniref:Uncharacterized protein n=1 Tax=Leifsonia tongyongensis TaxID=1268043 RepID=A0A6L9XWN1_9MICO|nr:hypothetical protein [Diaminobutyricibacter tongyongensis]NEN05829.1 hypothetical protein [Diaminobutyricibacter tongyongensis]
MNRWYPFRITTWWGKLLYVFGFWLVFSSLIGGALLNWTGIDDPGYQIYSLITVLGAYLIGARIFRGRGENPALPRPWWQMTARPKLSRRLGIVFVVLTALSVIMLVVDLLRVGPGPFAPVNDAFSVIVSGILAYLYLNSAARLKEAVWHVAPPIVAGDAG